MRLRYAAVGTFVFALIAAFSFAMIQRTSDISVKAATMSLTGGDETTLRAYFQIENQGGPDVLISAHSDYATTTSVIRPAEFAGAATAIPAHSTPAFSADGVFLELTGVRSDLRAGDLVPVTLSFQNAGEIRFKANVSESDHATMDHGEHVAGVLSDTQAEPQVALSAQRLSDDTGWKIGVTTTDFTFVDAPAGASHVYGQGHAHLYLNGLKLQRLYGETATIGALLPGTYTVRVTLNSNTHSVYLSGGKPVLAEASITSN